MSIATVVTRGYGSFGTINFLPTLGYTQFTVVIVDGPFCATSAQLVYGLSTASQLVNGHPTAAQLVYGHATNSELGC